MPRIANTRTPFGRGIKVKIKTTTKNVSKFLADAPTTMAELTTEFVSAKDLNTRAKIRQRMKAVLDFISVDTSYPDVGGDAGGVPPLPGFQDGAIMPARYIQNPTVRPIPGAENEI